MKPLSGSWAGADENVAVWVGALVILLLLLFIIIIVVVVVVKIPVRNNLEEKGFILVPGFRQPPSVQPGRKGSLQVQRPGHLTGSSAQNPI